MKNFIFKSSDFGLIKNVCNKLDIILAEQRHQRNDLAQIIGFLSAMKTDTSLQKQVDEYFEQDPFGSAFKESLDQTPPQTDSVEQ